jgi:hypothetical protein
MASVNFDDILADETSVETPTEAPAEAPAAKSTVSFDDILEEEPQQALPVGPRVGERVPISAREPVGYDPFADESLTDTAARRGQQFARGATEAIAAIPEAAEIGNRMRLREVQSSSADVQRDFPKELAELQDIIRQNAAKAEAGDFEALARVRAARMRLPQVEGQLRMAADMERQASEGLSRPIEKTPGFQAAEGIREGVTSLVGAPDERDLSFWGKVAEGGGSLAGMALSTVASSAFLTPLGGTIVGGIQGSAMNTSSVYKEAIAAGADEETAEAASRWAAAVGAAEVVPITRAFNFLPPQLRGKVTNEFLQRIVEVGQAGGEEAVQEFTSQVANNLIAKGYYDPERGWTEGALEAGAIGGILGLGIGAAAQIGRPKTETLRDEKAPSPDESAALTTGQGTPATPPAASTADPDQAAAIAATQPPPAPTPAPPPVAPAAPPPVAPTPTPPAPVGPAAGPTQAPPAPATPTQAERIREIARARQAAQQPVTAPQPEAGVAEGPQAGGPPAAPTSPPVTSEGSPPTPPVAPAPAAPTPPKQEAPKKVRTFTSESAPDILHAAGLKTGEIAGMKKGDQTRLTSLIRSALKSQYSPEELNSMPREEYNAAVAGIYGEINTATAPKAAPKPAAPPVAAAPVAEAETPAAPVAEAPVEEAPVSQPAPSITDAPSEGRVTKGSEVSAEERARMIAELEAKTAPKITPKPAKGEEIVEVSKGRTGRVLKDTSEQGAKREAEVQTKAQALAAKQAAEVKAAEERKAKLEQGPQGAKMNPVEVARRQANRTAATEIAQEFAPDNKSEKSFEDNTFEGNKAREAIRARAKRMIAAVEKRMSADEKGNKLPKSRKSSAKEEQALSPEVLLLMEARDLAKTTTKTPSVQSVARFRSAEALLRSGMVDEYMASRRADTDIANRKTPDLKTEEGESIDVAQTIVDTRSTPEEDLAAAQEGRPENEDYTPDTDEPTQLPIERERPKLVSEEQIGEFYTTPTAKKPPVVVVTRTGKLTRTGQDRASIPNLRDKPGIFKSKNPVSKGSKRMEELRAQIEELNIQIEDFYVLGSSDGKIDYDAVDALDRQRTQLQLELNDIDDAAPVERRFKKSSYITKIQNALATRRGFRPEEAKYATDYGSFSEMISRLTAYNVEDAARFGTFDFSYGGRELQRKVVPHILDQLNNVIGDIDVYVLPDADFDAIYGAKTGAIYNIGDRVDYIAIRESAFDHPKTLIHHLTHEGTHAALIVALRENPEAVKQLSEIAASVDERMNEGDYGFTDIDEFLAEFLSNPDFQVKVASTPVSKAAFDALGIPAPGGKSNNVLNLLRRLVAKILDLPSLIAKSFGPDDVSAYDATMAVVDSLLNVTPVARAKLNSMTSGKERMDYIGAAANRFEAYNENVLGNAGFYDQSPKERARAKYENIDWRRAVRKVETDKKPLSTWNRLMAGGVPPAIAREINDYLKAELGKTVDPLTLPLLIDDYIAEYGQPKVTPAGNAASGGGGNIQPPYQAPSTPGMGPGTPATSQPAPVRGKAPGRIAKGLRWFALRNMSLDFMRQKYKDTMTDAQGSIIDDIYVAAQQRDNLRDEFAKPINEITAEFTDLMKSNPKEGMELTDLAMEATRLDVRLGLNADNSHLGKNKATGLQGKKRLAALNQRFLNNLSDEGRDIYSRLTKAYRDAHNQNIEALVYSILAGLPQKLSTGDVMYLMKKVTNGTLDANDAALINDPEIYNGLKNAQELKVIKGDYFPQTRFGNHVVLTREKLVDPGWTSVPMKQMRAVPGKPGQRRTVVTQLPARTEVNDNALRVIVDPTVRGAQTAAMRALRDYAAKQDLTLQGIDTRFRDRQTGKLVSKGEQIVGRTYDTVYEARFQTDGVHYFEDYKDAKKFHETAQNVEGDILERRKMEETALPDGSVLGVILNRINSNKSLKDDEKKLLTNTVKNAIVMSMDGNSARSRYQARRNVKGASKDIARAAITYGQAAGNYYATLMTSPVIREGLTRLQKFEQETSKKPGGGEISEVANEMRRRLVTIEGGNEPVRFFRHIATLSFLDKLLSPAYSLINGFQPMLTTMPVLGGRYGFVRTNLAMNNAYRKAGTLGTAWSGVRNSAKAIRDFRRSSINSDDIIGSMRKNLGQEYEALIDKMLEVGAVSPDAGQEVAQAVENDRGWFSRNLGRVDRFARQMPNSIEAINRVVTAVATYDLAKDKKSKQEAIQEAIDTVFNTQGDYRKKNAPRWMQNPYFSWSLQFKKYCHLVAQLMADMAYRSFKGASPQERSIARWQLTQFMTTQAALSGAFGFAGIEFFKIGMLALSAVGLTDTWEENEEEMRDWLKENLGKTAGSMIASGPLSTLSTFDFESRFSNADLIFGFTPMELSKDNTFTYAGKVLLGAPGSMVIEWGQSLGKFAEEEYATGFKQLIPVKFISDTVQAVDELAQGEASILEGIGRVFGLRSMEDAEKSRQTSGNIRDFNQRKRTEKKLYDNLREALANKDRAAEFEARKALRQYRKELDRIRKTEK